MKKILQFLPFLALTFLVYNASAQCTYTLQMNDSYGDGWNGNTMDVLVGGAVVINDVTLSTGSSEEVTFMVNTGDDVTTVWNGGGSWGSETSYKILDSNGTEVGSATQADITSGTITASCPSCIAPNSLNTTNITLTSADLGWSSGGSGETMWNVEYGAQGFTQGMGTTVAVTTTSYSLTGLTANTNYDFYVQADCGGGSTSSWSQVGTFYTGYCLPAPSSVDNSGITNVTVGTINNTTGTETNNYGDYSSMVTDISAGVITTVNITYSTGYTYGTKIWVDLNDDLVFDDATELLYTGLSASTNPTTLSASITIPLSTSLGQHRMRIGGTDNNSGPSTACYTGSFGSFEDYTLNVIAPPSCLPPNTLTASNIAATSAELGWTSGGSGESMWDLEFGAAGFTQGTGGTIVTGVTSNPYSLTGLASGTSYDFYVRADCGTEESVWVGPFTFSTGLGCGNTFTDTGGTAGSYSNNENITTIICADDPTKFVQVVFSSFATENNWDGLTIHDGATASAPLIPSDLSAGSSPTNCPAGSYYGTTSPGTVTSTTAGGCLTFVFRSDGSTTQTGWEATVRCVTVINDDCDVAIDISDMAVYDFNTTGGTDSGVTGCATNPDDDLWYTVTTDDAGGELILTVTGGAEYEVFSGSCGSLVSEGCNGSPYALANNTPYYIRVYDSAIGFNGDEAGERAVGGTIQALGSALPVELTVFTGAVMEKYNELKWKTASEINTQEFVVQRSVNGQDWNDIATLEAAGNSIEELSYSYDDMRPASQSYYRLRMIDLDGTEQLSHIISLKREAKEFGVVSIAPNPTNDVTNVLYETTRSQNVQAVITDITGKVVTTISQNSVEGTNSLTVDLSVLPSGVYFLNLNNGATQLTQRIVKQ